MTPAQPGNERGADTAEPAHAPAQPEIDPVVAVARQIEDAELLLDHALAHRIAVPADVAADLRSARRRGAKALAAAGPDREGFLRALQALVDTVPVSAAALRSAADRRLRLLPLVRGAQRLMAFAAGNGKKVDDALRQWLITSADAVVSGTPLIKDEQDLLKGYEQLTVALAPVTAETLEASKTRLPDWTIGDSRARRRRVTLGRFVDATVFILVIAIVAAALGYRGQGAEVFARRDALKESTTRENELLDRLALELQGLQARAPSAQARTTSAGSAGRPGAAVGDAAASAPAAVAALEAVERKQQELARSKERVKQIQDDLKALPSRLWRWSQQPCGHWLTNWVLCGTIDQVPQGANPPEGPAQVLAAEAMLKWMNDVVLPLLLGLVGAYAWVIRRMTREIAEGAFAPGSTLRHITRLALGALAGLASGWLFASSETVSAQLRNTPAWVVAFIAGYGIELVFSFMDRIVNTFATSKT